MGAGRDATRGKVPVRAASILTQRRIGHDEAREIAQRLINSHFRQEPQARVSIPARPDYDDDLLMSAYIEQQRAKDESSLPDKGMGRV